MSKGLETCKEIKLSNLEHLMFRIARSDMDSLMGLVVLLEWDIWWTI